MIFNLLLRVYVKEVYVFFKKLMVTRSNAWQLRTNLTEDVLQDIQ